LASSFCPGEKEGVGLEVSRRLGEALLEGLFGPLQDLLGERAKAPRPKRSEEGWQGEEGKVPTGAAPPPARLFEGFGEKGVFEAPHLEGLFFQVKCDQAASPPF
jgi:hypothetical protein